MPRSAKNFARGWASGLCTPGSIVSRVDAASALADLTEISSQVEAAVLVDADGGVLASTVAGAAGERLARAGLALLEMAAADVAGGRAAP